jgi:hypothetical protein
MLQEINDQQRDDKAQHLRGSAYQSSTALIAAVLGFGGIAGAAVGIAKIVFFR